MMSAASMLPIDPWNAKLNVKKLPKHVKLDKDFAGIKAGRMLYVGTSDSMRLRTRQSRKSSILIDSGSTISASSSSNRNPDRRPEDSGSCTLRSPSAISTLIDVLHGEVTRCTICLPQRLAR
jgi:hypothetical protein